MSRLTAVFGLALVALSSFSFAQGKEDKTTLNQKAIQSFGAKKFDEGIAHLMRALDLEPKDTGTAYNVACGYSLKGDVEKGLEWLGKVERGGGYEQYLDASFRAYFGVRGRGRSSTRTR